MAVDPLHREIATIALTAASRHGFALAGGNALLMHGITSRETADVDLFTDREHGVEDATADVEKALADAGFTLERRDKTAGLADIWDGMGEGLAEWILTAPDGEMAMLQMAYFDRARPVVSMDVGPVLGLDDVAAGKVNAIGSRVEPRDFIDLAALLAHGYTVDRLLALGHQLDPGLGPDDFAEAGAQLDLMSDEEFAHYGLGAAAIAVLRERLAAWPRPA